jgi:hypothetical protein
MASSACHREPTARRSLTTSERARGRLPAPGLCVKRASGLEHGSLGCAERLLTDLVSYQFSYQSEQIWGDLGESHLAL